MEAHIIVTKVLSAILVDSRVMIFILILLFELSSCNTLRKQRLNPFQIKSIEHGSYFKVLPDGSIKAQEAHSSLFQTSDVWFTACNSKSIIDDRSSRSDSALSFDICQADDRDEYNERKLVYDTINDYFKIITSVEQLKEVCEKEVDRCHLLPMMAKVVSPNDVHIEIVPHGNRRLVLNVEKVKGNAPYGKVSMIKRKNLRKLQALLKIEEFS